jgi:signal transduction histidine kinase
MQDLERRFSGLRRSLVRRIAQLDDSAMQSVEPLLGSKTWTADKETALQELLQSYEAGVHLRSADAATDRIIRLVRSLKNYGRHDPSQHEQVDLRDCIHDTLMVLNHRLKHFELTVRAKEVPLFWCHPGEINQVLTNLLVNACDATPQGGLIQLTCFTADNGDICVEVSDAGHGIDAALIDRIFEPNFTTKHRSGDFGLGLGLAISRDIARKYGGSLEAQSEPGKGARFVLRLPQGSRLPHNGAASA